MGVEQLVHYLVVLLRRRRTIRVFGYLYTIIGTAIRRIDLRQKTRPSSFLRPVAINLPAPICFATCLAMVSGPNVYFLLTRISFGGMADQTVVPYSQGISIPDGLDATKLAATADPGMSAWTALELCARLVIEETNGGSALKQ